MNELTTIKELRKCCRNVLQEKNYIEIKTCTGKSEIQKYNRAIIRFYWNTGNPQYFHQIVVGVVISVNTTTSF